MSRQGGAAQRRQARKFPVSMLKSMKPHSESAFHPNRAAFLDGQSLHGFITQYDMGPGLRYMVAELCGSPQGAIPIRYSQATDVQS